MSVTSRCASGPALVVLSGIFATSVFPQACYSDGTGPGADAGASFGNVASDTTSFSTGSSVDAGASTGASFGTSSVNSSDTTATFPSIPSTLDSGEGDGPLFDVGDLGDCSGEVAEPIPASTCGHCGGLYAYALCEGLFYSTCSCDLPPGYVLVDGGDLDGGSSDATEDAAEDGGSAEDAASVDADATDAAADDARTPDGGGEAAD
jgi:hypothetical protein